MARIMPMARASSDMFGLRSTVPSGTTTSGPEPPRDGVVRAGELVIDDQTYSCKLRGRGLDLTFKEFELLKYLAQHPGRVFSRAQLLQEVWGYDYYGGTRTVVGVNGLLHEP